jgi:hypothetical protein
MFFYPTSVFIVIPPVNIVKRQIVLQESFKTNPVTPESGKSLKGLTILRVPAGS